MKGSAIPAPDTMPKSFLTLDVLKQCPGLKKRLFSGSELFSRGCYYGSAGTVSAGTIIRYIEEYKVS